MIRPYRPSVSLHPSEAEGAVLHHDLASQSAAAGEFVKEPSAVVPRQATSSLPLRWRIPYARHVISPTGFLNCDTVVSTTGFGPDPTNIDVEFFDDFGASAGLSSVESAPPGVPQQHLTNPFSPTFAPFTNIDATASTPNFNGYALVFADDPRVFVGAYLVCTEAGVSGNGFPRLVTNLSAYPVGQTATFFQAGMPTTAPISLLAEPES